MWTSTSGVVIVAFAVLAAVVLSVGAYLVSIASAVLPEAALQAVLATAFVRSARKRRGADWMDGVFKSTRWLFMLVALAAFLVGSAALRVCPTATTASEALLHCETP
jgi:hypothetical protein